MNKSSMNNPSSSDQDGKIVDQAKQAVTHVASQAKEQVNAQFDTRKDKAVETIGNVATAIRETSDKLKGVGPLSDVAGRAADGIESVAEFFEGEHIGDIVRDVEKFARREPALFVGAAFALGLIGGRFLKSSAPHASATGAGGQYARSGSGGSFDRYESSYGASAFGDDDYLSDAELKDDIDSQRFGAYGSAQRLAGRTTQPLGSRTGMGSGASKPQGSSMSGSGSSMSGGSCGGSPQCGPSQGGSSQGATQASPAGSSFGASASPTTNAASTPPAAGTTSITPPSTSTSGSTTPKNGLGGGNMGSV